LYDPAHHPHLMLPGGTPFSTAGSFKKREWFAGVAALTAVAVSTGLFAFPNGISGIGSGLVSFINRWDSISIVPIEAALTVICCYLFPAADSGRVWLFSLPQAASRDFTNSFRLVHYGNPAGGDTPGA